MKLLLLPLILLLSLPAIADSEWDKAALTLPEATEIKVYRSPDCQCCHKWVEHLKQHQFKVIDLISHDMASVKQQAGLPAPLASCHTAIVDGYLIEGHVPADDIKRLLLDKPDIKGLSVPQMPVGTPGMEMGSHKDDFTVIQFDHNNQFDIYNRYQVGTDQLYHAAPPSE
ncbi:DUF411 domain-containing protein [Methylophaga sp. OBS4]|uniref:DUF411 domain-containing protein n=1 Tax=Methylophaga sp. OBS4 TaxID=2991935 RepID=UPI002257DB31|nr:DUF411 domain-containing protein [Methylophaga sp. OBS4]MCX4188228.1 DUF411 domain-containing protein [Methylophaga sp. OBS4]